MKTAEKAKQPSKGGAKALRRTEPVRQVEKEVRRVQAEKPRVESQGANGSSPMPDLKSFGLSEGDARAHVTQCEPCGRAHKHVVKNPKDAMALDSFGRRISCCLADNREAPHS